MKITAISRENIQSIENFASKLPVLKSSTKSQNIDSIEDSNQNILKNEWNLDILSNAIDKLANSLQMSNNHPLSLVENYPIENFAEAWKELKKLKSEILSKDGKDAQANLEAIRLIDLFVD